MKIVQFRPLLLGSLIFFLNLGLILIIISGGRSFSSTWLSLASHWDSEWYEAIAQYGYINIDGPYKTGLRNANVVFFPGYPYLARSLINVLNINSKVALLIVSQFFTLFFWILVCNIIKEADWYKQVAVILLLAFFPTSWFFYTGYSESSFIFATVLSLWLFQNNKWILAGIIAAYMTSTRIIGTPVLIVPFLTIFILNSQKVVIFWQQNAIHRLINLFFKPSLIGIIGVCGVGGFLLYCQLKFGSWHLYFDMEKFGWHGEAYPYFIFKIQTWLPPPWGFGLDFAPIIPDKSGIFFGTKFFRLAAYTFSETLVPIFMWTSVIFSYFIFKNKKEIRSLSYYLAMILILLFYCLSLYTRYYESMSRCLYSVWILLILSDISHSEGIFIFKLKKYNFFIFVGVLLFIMSCYWLQLLNRFNLGWWVA